MKNDERRVPLIGEGAFCRIACYAAEGAFFPPEGLAQSTTLIVSGNLEKISWTLNEVFHRTTRLDEYVYRQDSSWDWGKPFDTGILNDYWQGGAVERGSIFQDIYEDIRMMLRRDST